MLLFQKSTVWKVASMLKFNRVQNSIVKILRDSVYVARLYFSAFHKRWIFERATGVTITKEELRTIKNKMLELNNMIRADGLI